MSEHNLSQDEVLPNDMLETMSAANPEAENTDGDLSAPGEVGEDDKSEYSRHEIPMSDLPDAPREEFIHSPELSDSNVPGEIDIEDLDEDSVTESLPPDARLDPLED